MRKVFLGIVVLTFVGVQSCTKDLSENTGGQSLETNLTAASASVTSAVVTEVGSEDIQTTSMTKLDGTDPDAVLLGMPMPRDGMGKFIGMEKGMFRIPRMSSCATVTVQDSVYPKTIVIDYGTGCTDGKRHVKKGKITLTISDNLVVAGAEKTIKYENFYVDSNKIERTATIKNLGKNEAGNWVLVSSSVQTITKPNGEYVKETYTDTIKWVSGFTTKDKSDDKYYKSTYGSLVLNDTARFSVETLQPLLYDNSCQFVSSGIVKLTRNGVVTTIDYGDGTCDNIAAVTTDGTTEEINLNNARFRMGTKFDNHCKGFGHYQEHKGGK